MTPSVRKLSRSATSGERIWPGGFTLPAVALALSTFFLSATLLATSAYAGETRTPEEQAHSSTIFGSTNVLLSDGASKLEAGQVEEGLRLTLAGLKESVDRHDIAAGHANACAGFVLLQQFDQALDHCNQAVEMDGGNWRAFNNRAAIYVAKGLFELALRDIHAGLEIAPNSRTLLESLRVAQHNKRIMESRSRRLVPS